MASWAWASWRAPHKAASREGLVGRGTTDNRNQGIGRAPVGGLFRGAQMTLRSSHCLLLGTYGEEAHGLSKDSRNSHRRGAAMTDRSYEIPRDADLRNLARLVSACTLGLWAFSAGLLIGVFLFS